MSSNYCNNLIKKILLIFCGLSFIYTTKTETKTVAEQEGNNLFRPSYFGFPRVKILF